MSVVHVTLTQDGREEIVGYVTQSNLAAESGATFDTQWTSRSSLQAYDVSRLEHGEDPIYVEKQSWPNPKFRKATTQLRTWFPRNGQPIQSGYDFWSCPADSSEKWTNESLGYLVDMFPQVVESYLLDGVDPYSPRLDTDPSLNEKTKRSTKDALLYWYPTVLLNLDVKKALPEEGVKFLFTRVQSKQIKNGRFDLEVVIADAHGDIVALSHHVCLLVSSARNTAARRKADDVSKL